MPDDPIFPDAAPPESHQAGSSRAAGVSPPGPDPTAARLGVVENTLASLAQSQGQTATILQQINQQLQQLGRPAPAPEAAPLDPNDLVSQLASDPEGTIKRVAQSALKEGNQAQLQVLGTLINTQHQNLVDDAEFDVDRQFGEGSWKEVIKPKLDPFLSELRTSNPTALADHQTLTRLVNMLKGEQMQALVDRQTKHQQSLATQEEAGVKKLVDQISPHLPAAGLKRVTNDPSGQDIPGLDLMRAELKREGMEIDPKEFAKYHNAGNTLSDFLKLQPKAGERTQ